MLDVNADNNTAYRLEEAATRARLSLAFIRRDIARGELEVIRFGRMVRVTDAALREYLAKRTSRS
jgi:excisionase family DNA binding protein